VPHLRTSATLDGIPLKDAITRGSFLNYRQFQIELRALNRKWAYVAAQLVRAKAPRKDGKLRRQVRAELIEQPGVIGFVIVCGAIQAWFTEYGTGRYSIAEDAPKKQWIYPKRKGAVMPIDIGNAAYSNSKIPLNNRRTFRSSGTAKRALEYASAHTGTVKQLGPNTFKAFIFVKRIKGQHPQEWLAKILEELRPHYEREVDELCAKFGFSRS
jgi:hypothetical protein